MNIGFIGTSWISEAFIDGINKTDTFTLHSVYSRNLTKALSFATKNNIPNHYDSLEALLSDPLLDIVYIASPNSLHFKQAMLALKHHKNIIVEKPMFLNIEQFHEALECAKANNLMMFEAIRNYYDDNALIVKEALNNKTITNVNLSFEKYSSKYNQFLNNENPNIFNPEFGGGALRDLGVYLIHFSIMMFGYPNKVKYLPYKLNNGIDGSGVAILEYDTFSAILSSSKIFEGNQTNVINTLEETFIIDGISVFDDFRSINTYDNTIIKKYELNAVSNNMQFEVKAIYDIITKQDIIKYEDSLKQSELVLKVIDQLIFNY